MPSTLPSRQMAQGGFKIPKQRTVKQEFSLQSRGTTLLNYLLNQGLELSHTETGSDLKYRTVLRKSLKIVKESLAANIVFKLND